MVCKTYHRTRHLLLRYHVEFELYYDTFHDFGRKFWKDSPPPSTIHDFISQILCERESDEYFTKGNVLVVKNAMIVEI